MITLARLSLSSVAMAVAIASVSTVACSSSSRAGIDTSEPPAPPISTGDGGGGPDSGIVCLSEQVKAETVPLAMLVVIDRSGSMLGEKWDAATKAIRAFADRSEVVGMKMGVQFFPPLSGTDECNGSSYKALPVPIAALPDNVLPIQQRLEATDANGGGTPMRSGLEGSIGAMRDFLDANPLHEGVVILVTDGDPGACSGVDTVANVSSIASAAAKGTPRIRTFVVGMDGATFSNLNTIAVAGDGAPTAFNASATGDAGVSAQQQLLDALEKIRSGALGCEYVLPVPEANKGTVDPASVEIEFTAGKNDPPAKFRRVDSVSQCGEATGGFYYDNPTAPKRLILCPASCEDVKKGTAASKLDVVLGCIKQVN